MKHLLVILEYLKARLDERSTWAAIGVGVTGAAALSSPWSIIVAAVGVIGALVPSPGKSDDA
jgi:hypothetical protein